MAELYDHETYGIWDAPQTRKPTAIKRVGDLVFWGLVCYAVGAAWLFTERWVNGPGC